MTWVKPELVCQVKFANWTQDNRLRAPVFLGLRNDKPAAEVVREPRRRRGGARRMIRRQPSRMPRKPRVEIDGHRLKFTNLKKVFYPDEGYTKRDVLNYYDGVADLILPHLKDRPLSLKRYPERHQGGVFLSERRAGELSPPGCAPS